MTANLIKATLAKRFKKQKRAVYFELGLNRGGRYRADVFALAMTGHVIVVEAKSSVQDFRTDRKMHNYLPFCNKFYLACTSSVYSKIDFKLPGAGVFILSDDCSRVVKVKPAKNRAIDPEVLSNLIIRAAFRNSDSCTRKNVRV